MVIGFVYPWLLSVISIITTVVGRRDTHFRLAQPPLLAANIAQHAKFRWANMLADFLFWNGVQKNVERLGSPSYCSGPSVHSCESTRVWSSVREASWPSRCWSLSRECWQSVPIVFTADQTTKWTRTGTAAVGQSSQAKQGCYSNHTDITAHLMLPCTHHIPSSAKLDSAVLTSHSQI